MKRLLSVLLVLALTACADKPAEPADAGTAAAPAPVAAEPAATPAPTPAPTTSPDGSTDAAADAPTDAAADVATAEGEAPVAPTPPTPPAPPVTDPATAPRPGVDYTVLPTPQPTFGSGPGIEVAEVFAYTCIHCANLQGSVTSWKAQLPADVRFEYVPGAFGGVSDNFARAFFAAQVAGLLDKTHEAMFNAHFVEQKFQTGSVEELAAHYVSQGADEATFLSTMNSFSITTKVNRARQFALRTGVNSTPSFIVNGKYMVQQNDRGPQGVFDAIEFLVAHERAGTTP
jgi:thiol:disulfide interchange protein DsbA